MTLTQEKPLQEIQSFEFAPKVFDLMNDQSTKKDFNNKPTTLKFDIYDVTSVT